MSWLVKTVDKRPSTCPVARSSRTNAAVSKPAEAVSQDDAVVRQVSSLDANASCSCEICRYRHQTVDVN